MPLLSAFDIWNGTWAPYAAMMNIELLDMPTSTTPVVRLVYNGQVMQIPGCATTLCTWKEFQNVMNGIVSYGEGECVLLLSIPRAGVLHVTCV